MRRIIGSIVAVLVACSFALTAHAQIPALPVLQNIDAQGVDVVLQSYNSTQTDISIGPSDIHGLKYTRYWASSGWRHSFVVTMSGRVAAPVVSIGGKSESFTQVTNTSSGITYSNDINSGSTLIREAGGSTADFVYTGRDGTIVRFMYANGATLSQYDSSLALARYIQNPDGTKITFTYKTGSYSGPQPGGGTYTTYLARIQSVDNSTGYQMKFTYPQNTLSSANVDQWQNPSRITAINSKVEYCNPAADSCALTGNWPHADYVYVTSASYQANLMSVSDALGRTWNYTYSILNDLATIRRPGSSTDDVVISHSPGVSSVQIGSDSWSYAYATNASGPVSTTVTNPFSKTRTYTIKYNQVLSMKDEMLKTTSYLYDCGAQQPNVVTYPEGNYIKATCDLRANVTSSIQHAKTGSSSPDIGTSANYSSSCTNPVTCNKPNWSIDANGNRTDYTYDTSTGNVQTVQAPAATVGGIRPTTTYSYTTVNGVQLLAGTSTCIAGASCVGTANEVKTSIGYNANGLPITVTKQAGNGSIISTTTMGYDNIGNVVSIDGPLSGSDDTTYYRYNADRELIGVVSPDPDGTGPRKRKALRSTYDIKGRVTLAEIGTVTDASDAAWSAFSSLQQVATNYDGLDRPLNSTVTAGGTTYSVTQSSYDHNRLDCTAVRMNGAAWGSLPASACTLQTAGGAGPDRVTKFSYDDADRQTKVTTAYGTADAADQVTLTYTDNGRRATVADANGNVTSYAYNEFDRLSRTCFQVTTSAACAGTPGDYEQLSYDANGNVLSRRLRDGTSIAFAYDALNRVTTKTSPSPDYGVSYGYDLLGHVTQLARAGDGITVNLGYDALGRLTSDSQPFGSMTYQYDVAGRRTRETWGDGFYVTYDYDTAGNVTAVRENGSAALATYGYDDLGRRTSLTRGNGVVTSYAFDGASQLSSLTNDLAGTSQDLTLSFVYNPAGQITSRTGSNDAYAYSGSYAVYRAYGVNGLNQLTSAGTTSLGYDARGNLTSSDSTTYAYTSENRLKASNGASLYYDDLNRLVEYDATTSTRMFYSGGEIAAEVSNPGNSILRRYIRGPGDDEPIVWYEGSGTSDRRYLVADERGSIIAVTDGTGGATTINRYDAHGIPQSGNAGRFQYTGQAWLPEIGLAYYKARMYSPTLGRFMQTDPIGYGDGMNWYNYAGSDPVNATDPSGLTTGSLIDTGPGLCGACSGFSWGGGSGSGERGSEKGDRAPSGTYLWGQIQTGSNGVMGPWRPIYGELTPPNFSGLFNPGGSTIERGEITVTARQTPVYRAIDDAELAAMVGNRMGFVPSPGGLEVKYFWPKPEYAFAFGKEYIRQGWVSTSVHIVASTLPAGMNYSTVNVADLSRYGMGNVYAITVPNSDLYRIAPATVIGYIPFKR